MRRHNHNTTEHITTQRNATHRNTTVWRGEADVFFLCAALATKNLLLCVINEPVQLKCSLH